MFHDIRINVHYQQQHNIALFCSHQHNTNNILLTVFNNTQQHNDMPQNVDIVGQQYIAINIVNVCLLVLVSSEEAFNLNY